MRDDPVHRALRRISEKLRDLNVQELIRVLRLPVEFAGGLNPFVREKYCELWSGVREDQSDGPSS